MFKITNNGCTFNLLWYIYYQFGHIVSPFLQTFFTIKYLHFENIALQESKCVEVCTETMEVISQIYDHCKT